MPIVFVVINFILLLVVVIIGRFLLFRKSPFGTNKKEDSKGQDHFWSFLSKSEYVYKDSNNIEHKKIIVVYNCLHCGKLKKEEIILY